MTKMIAGRILEDGVEIKTRLGISETTLLEYVKRGMPEPIRLGRFRWFDREAVDQWLLAPKRQTDEAAE